jgi:hypothetical protein
VFAAMGMICHRGVPADLPDAAPRARLARTPGPIRQLQGHRDPCPAPRTRRPPPPEPTTDAHVGRPGHPQRAEPAPPPLPAPPPDRDARILLCWYAQAGQAPLDLPTASTGPFPHRRYCCPLGSTGTTTASDAHPAGDPFPEILGYRTPRSRNTIRRLPGRGGPPQFRRHYLNVPRPIRRGVPHGCNPGPTPLPWPSPRSRRARLSLVPPSRAAE